MVHLVQDITPWFRVAIVSFGLFSPGPLQLTSNNNAPWDKPKQTGPSRKLQEGYQFSCSGILGLDDEGVDLIDDGLFEAVAEDLDLAGVAASLGVDRERGVRQRRAVVLDVDLVLALFGRGVADL